MNTGNSRILYQGGVALVFSLLLLLIMTIIGVATMSSANMQQRMAGNAYLQSQAFEAASAGVANALAFRDEAWPEGQTCNASTSDEWFGDWQEIGQVGNGFLSQRMYCVSYSLDDESGASSGYELFVLSRGEIRDGADENQRIVATRDIEVRIGRFGGPPGPICQSVAMCFPIKPDLDLGECDSGSDDFCSCIGDVNPFSGFQSNNFSVYGQEFEVGHGPALALPPNFMLAFECAVTGGQTAEQCEAGGDKGKCSRLDNYNDSIVSTEDFGEPWDDPADAYALVEALRENYARDGNGMHVDSNHADWKDQINMGGGEKWTGVDWSGSHNLPGLVTYVDGDAILGGGVTGSGFLVIEGRMAWNGTPQFNGLIIVLGGVFQVSGGGQGGDAAGSVVVVDLQPKPSDANEVLDPDTGELIGMEPAVDPFYGDTFNVTNTGGGAAEYAFGCDELNDAWGELSDETQTLWQPNCDPDAEPPAISLVEGIASWRENIGWRTEEFPGAQKD